ncbi:hypothetical protein NGB36_12000 [Streptomyces sp. RB6PN25]|uniref:Transposase n=1 Tax=Streptomyces humicola TaxID=2953240 RepID=A0ABT1PUF2_9ACTN|nr:hypothetical protein [Streptomyces humicola]MCQ4081303.1 hypothetical protein [Streptomyces humicola]
MVDDETGDAAGESHEELSGDELVEGSLGSSASLLTGRIRGRLPIPGVGELTYRGNLWRRVHRVEFRPYGQSEVIRFSADRATFFQIADSETLEEAMAIIERCL